MCQRLFAFSLNGYTAVTVATINYYWTNSNNNDADFRYDFHELSLSDTAGNADTMYSSKMSSPLVFVTHQRRTPSKSAVQAAWVQRAADNTPTVCGSTATSKPQW